MSSKRARTTVIATIALATSATLGLASAATAAEVAAYPFDLLPGMTINSPYPTYEIEIDCDEWEAGWADDSSYGDVDLVWVPDGEALVSFTCTPDDVASFAIDDDLDAGDFPSGYEQGPADTGFDTAYKIEPNTEFEVQIGEQTLEINYYATIEIDDPAEGLLFTQTLTTPANGAQSVDFEDGDALNDDDFECGLEDVRVYAKAEFTVLEGGTFTFRIVDVAPLQSGELFDNDVEPYWTTYEPNPWGDYVTIADPYLVLYSDFDPSAPNEGQIDCNDDGSFDVDGANAYPRDSQDRFLSWVYSELIVDLEPGEYTLVLTTYDEVETLDEVLAPTKLDAASVPVAPADYELAGLPEQSADVEIWGAADSLELGHAAALADTGADTSLQAGLAGGAVLALLLGALGIAIARRRTA